MSANKRESHAITAIGLVIAASAVLSAESPTIEAFLNFWVITAIAVAVGVALVVAAIRWLWGRSS